MKFSIRDLLLVTVIVALAVGWWVDHRRSATLEQERDEALYDAKFLARWGAFHLGRNGEVAAIARDVLAKYDVRYHSSDPAPNPPKP